MTSSSTQLSQFSQITITHNDITEVQNKNKAATLQFNCLTNNKNKVAGRNKKED